MIDLIGESDRIDRMLHAAGVPADHRMRAVAQIMDVLAQASKARRDRRQLVLESVKQCGGNVRKAAKQEGWSHETYYAELRKLSKTPVTV